jgi:flagellin-like protein
MKGVSPIIAVIVLIMFTLVIAGMLAGWATQFAQTQRNQFEQCIDAKVLIRGGTYNSTAKTLTLVVYNWGKVPLTLSTLIDYDNGTSVKVPGTLAVAKGDIANNVIATPNNMDAVTIQSQECPGVQDFLRSTNIKGL